MRFAYYDRLSPSRQSIYRDSDAIEVLELPVGAIVAAPVGAIATVCFAQTASTRGAVVRLCSMTGCRLSRAAGPGARARAASVG